MMHYAATNHTSPIPTCSLLQPQATKVCKSCHHCSLNIKTSQDQDFARQVFSLSAEAAFTCPMAASASTGGPFLSADGKLAPTCFSQHVSSRLQHCSGTHTTVEELRLSHQASIVQTAPNTPKQAPVHQYHKQQPFNNGETANLCS